MDIRQNIAANIQRYKLERDLTVAELAKELDLGVCLITPCSLEH